MMPTPLTTEGAKCTALFVFAVVKTEHDVVLLWSESCSDWFVPFGGSDFLHLLVYATEYLRGLLSLNATTFVSAVVKVEHDVVFLWLRCCSDMFQVFGVLA